MWLVSGQVQDPVHNVCVLGGLRLDTAEQLGSGRGSSWLLSSDVGDDSEGEGSVNFRGRGMVWDQ